MKNTRQIVRTQFKLFLQTAFSFKRHVKIKGIVVVSIDDAAELYKIDIDDECTEETARKGTTYTRCIYRQLDLAVVSVEFS